MNPLTRLYDWLFTPVERPADADEAFLAAAVDMQDLERRMRQLDRAPLGSGGGNA